MSKKVFYGLAGLFAAAFELLSGVLQAFAQGPCGAPICDSKGVIDFFNNIAAWLATIFWIFAVIAGFYAGFMYLTANGDEKKISTAHKQLLYTVIAIAVGLMVYGLPALIKNILAP